MKYTIDATGKSLGRVASNAAVLLRGKENTTYERHTAPVDMVEIVNASKLLISERRAQGTTYRTHTGRPGSEKVETLARLINRRGHSEALIRAIKGMLPANRLRPIMMKNLTIKN